MHFGKILISATVLLAVVARFTPASAAPAAQTILNVSYDPTRELYQDYDAAFAKYWKAKTGQDVTINQSPRRLGQAGARGDRRARGRRRHARPRLRHRRDRRQGQPAAGRLADAPARQQHALHLDDRVPGAQGQSQGHQGLGRSGEAGRRGRDRPIPKTSGGARWAYLAAWGYALKAPGGSDASGQGSSSPSSTRTCRCSIPARAASTTTFVERGIGDVLLSWENEAYLALKEFGSDKFEIVYPSMQHPRRAAGRGGRQGRRPARHARGGRGLPGVPLFDRRARKSRRSTSIARGSRRRCETRAGFSAESMRSPVERSVVRRLAEGAEDAFRRRRRVRPDLSAGTVSGPDGSPDVEDRTKSRSHAHQRAARLRPDDGLSRSST